MRGRNVNRILNLPLVGVEVDPPTILLTDIALRGGSSRTPMPGPIHRVLRRQGQALYRRETAKLFFQRHKT